MCDYIPLSAKISEHDPPKDQSLLAAHNYMGRCGTRQKARHFTRLSLHLPRLGSRRI
jgi:hypothetical protein